MTNIAEQDRWYVIICKPKQEEHVRKALMFRNVEVFLPKQKHKIKKKEKNRPNKMRSRFRPLFPGYLFMRANLAKLRFRYREVPGVLGLIVGGDSKPTPVHDGEVEALRIAHDKEGGFVIGQPPLKSGQQLEVPSGPFAGYAGTIARVCAIEGELRISVTIDADHFSFELSIPKDDL